ncbi:CBS domain-containing protein [Aestuariibacter sp. AA17]|uniref:CBS domain-containing protein n=1 Tax=Fluctibacter corallii TaxID=2984329 RepID=A0ABT3AA12_9ALTE|nr:CBS domain-containing protein [Aestuariibacter sp. AA17]MCV2885444.1 CBS domain-containing protein [Aestuariibacter sp. AA17]
MNTDLFTVDENVTLREALQKIDQNSMGIIFSVDEVGRVSGVATDGDIRRKLLSGVSLDNIVANCVNRNFIYANEGSSREYLLKRLDQTIKAIPLIDESGKLVRVITRDSFPPSNQEPVYARSRAPVRISFGGGGSDLTHFFSETDGAVINSTIALYSHATLRIRTDESIAIYSRDLNDTLEAKNLSELLQHKGNFSLIVALLKMIQPEFGFELFLHSDFRMKSGLGGSAVVTAAILGCFNQFRQDRWDLHELAEIAYQAERHYLGIEGGWQDQYASVFGGFNFMEFKMEQNIVHPLRIHPDVMLELEENLLLCDSNLDHDSGKLHAHQRVQMTKSTVKERVEKNVRLTYEMRNDLLRGKLTQFGQDLHEAWQLKRQFSDKISSPKLDEIYNIAIDNGAIGGKLLGAGGGGFFLFYVPAFKRINLIKILEEKGLNTQQFRFEQEGLRSWMVRESI